MRSKAFRLRSRPSGADQTAHRRVERQVTRCASLDLRRRLWPRASIPPAFQRSRAPTTNVWNPHVGALRRSASASAGSLGSRNIPSSYSVAHAFRLGQARTRTNNLPVLTGLVFHARRPFGTHRSQPGTARWHQRDPTSPAITQQRMVRFLRNFGAFDDSLWRYRIPTFEAIGTQKQKRPKIEIPGSTLGTCFSARQGSPQQLGS